MSNPIGDTVEYFKRRHQNKDPQHRYSESSLSRRKHHIFSRRSHDDHDARSVSLDYEASQPTSSTWDRVLSKLTYYTNDDTEHSTSTRAYTNEANRYNNNNTNHINDSQEEEQSEDDIQDNTMMGINRRDTSDGNRDSIELIKEHRWLDRLKLRSSLLAGLSQLDPSNNNHNQTFDRPHNNNNRINDDEDQLPSTCDFTHDILNDDVDAQTNYFTHPFQSTLEVDQVTPSPFSISNNNNNNNESIPTTAYASPSLPQLTPSSSQQPTIGKRLDSLPKSARFQAIPIQLHDDDNQQQTIPSSLESSKIIPSDDNQQQQQSNQNYLKPGDNEQGNYKTSWDKTKDKIKLITSLQNQSSNQLDTPTTSITTNTTLAPYYPPAFDPLFIAFSKDEHGNKLVKIIYNKINRSQ